MTTATINGKKERPALWYERDRWADAKDREAIDELTDWVKRWIGNYFVPLPSLAGDLTRMLITPSLSS